MTRALAITVFALGASAFAATSEEGGAIFNASCAQCHTATSPLFTADGKGKPAPVPASRSRWAGPDLVKVITTRPNAQIRKWIASPTKVKENTSCRTFGMPQPAVDSVLLYLISASKPPALTEKALLRKNLKEGLERQKKIRPTTTPIRDTRKAK